jgi:hypothetical protein
MEYGRKISEDRVDVVLGSTMSYSPRISVLSDGGTVRSNGQSRFNREVTHTCQSTHNSAYFCLITVIDILLPVMVKGLT